MPPKLVIQDSDESDAELSDISTSIDPLQDNTTTTNTVITLRDFPPIYQHEQYDSNNTTNQVVEETINGTGNGPDSDYNNHAPPSFDPNLSVNFDQFLTSQSQDQIVTGPVSLSQQRRERAWLGEEDQDGAYSNSMQLSARGACSSSRKSILKRGRTIDVENIGADNVVARGKDVKRRRTMDVSGTFQDAVGKCVGFAGSLEQDDGGYGVGAEVTLEQMIDTDTSLSPTNDNEDSIPTEDLATEAPNTFNDPSTIETIPEPLATSGPEAHSRKQPSGRSKSTQGFDDTAYDTEPMSSITLARAHRTTSSSFISAPPSSTESTRDELALPPVVQVAITNMRPTAMQRKKPSVAETAGIESDRDELDCINADFGGMPKERYKPRPSRSRSSKTTVDTSMGPDGSEKHSVEVVVPCEDFSVTHTCQANKDGDSIIAEITNNPEADMLNSATQETPREPLETPKRLKVVKKKVKRGKTTSVMLKRAVESDVEDDVIWIDEKPENVTFRDTQKRNSSFKSRKAERHEESNEKASSNSTEDIQEQTALKAKTEDERDVKLDEVQQLPPNPTPTATAPAPKKRGRKRKKTSDSLTAEPLPPIAETEPSMDGKKDIQPLAEQHQNIPLLENAQEEKDSKPDTAADMGTAAKVNQVPQPNEEVQKKPMTDVVTSAPHSPSPQSPELQPQPSTTTPAPEPVETPKKPHVRAQKGPDKHSPITVNNKVPYRVGLSRTARIAPLLKVVRK
ncbi:hypothetical protein EMCG_04590 [[Emmonsia] crescens]|uniref:Uncharacterized protein n=1 Tax=[Emmonsia] crescens TaxID=73230 RepID=A0A0G2HRJ5_9EURO|nr:hypothetical protein EMCG_04590 [Emmonsia crescens UAMH 3008]